MASEASELRRGNAIKLNGELLIVAEMNHVKPGKGPAYLQSRLRSVATGAIREYRFRMNESVDRVFTEQKAVTFSYRAGDDIVFMDDETFEEYHMPAESAGEAIRFFAEGERLSLQFADGDLIAVIYPDYVVRSVAQTMQGVKAAKVTNQVKPATLDVGVEVAVPIFIKEGERIRIQTETGKYHERAGD